MIVSTQPRRILAPRPSIVMISQLEDFDPLDVFTRPPANESLSDRIAREAREQEAIQTSLNIDAELKTANAALKLHKNAVKILVLGQSLSGKSTTVKNFQMAYAQKSWAEERVPWKGVILLNLVRSVNVITEVLESYSNNTSQGSSIFLSIEHHRSALLRLTPLRQIEKDLKRFLGAGSIELEGLNKSEGADSDINNKTLVPEFSLRSSSGWKSILSRVRNPHSGKDLALHRVACHVVRGCKDDIQGIWRDTAIQKILHSQNIRLQESPGFFLNDVDRVTTPDYEPSDQDILRARLRTTGVQEYHFVLDRSNGIRLDWIMYDVAGIRTSRAAWIPYFRDITALIFLAPLSGFNERLEEDDSVNRLEDSFMLWKTICSTKLLANIQLILFMNKTDILRRKIEQGNIQVKKYIPDYNKPNDFENAAAFFRRAFKKIYMQTTPPESPKTFISHFTTVVDAESTAHTLRAVQSTILRNDISEAGLM